MNGRMGVTGRVFYFPNYLSPTTKSGRALRYGPIGKLEHDIGAAWFRSGEPYMTC